jgi:hypothetical protein
MTRFLNAAHNDLSWPKLLTVQSLQMLLAQAVITGSLFILTIGLVVPQKAFALGFTHHGELSLRPSNLTSKTPFKVSVYYRCVSVLDGSLLDCPITHSVKDLKAPATDPDNNGGHTHSSGRPFVLTDTTLEYPQDSDADPLVVSSSSLAGGGNAFVLHMMPEASGTFEVEGILGSPPGWFCASSCYTLTTHRFLTAYKVAIRDTLIELPAADNVYVRCARTSDCASDSPGDSRHDSVFYGRPSLVNTLVGLAAMYRSQTGELLRITDMNLIKGGVLDIDGTWTKPHGSHRTGSNADISRFALKNNTAVFLDQDTLDGMAQDLRLRRLREKSTEECPVLQPGEPPCIHLTIP